jgi:uncharacterized protein DUF3108
LLCFATLLQTLEMVMPLLHRTAFAVLVLAPLVAAGPLSAQSTQTDTPAASATPPVESPAGPEPMEEPKLGDHWTYEVRDEITGEVKSTVTNTVTDVSDSEISTRTAQLGSPGFGFLTFDRSWNLTNNGATRATPNDGTGIRSPLAVGKTWSFKASEVNSTTGYSGKRSGTAKVVAQESVTTRAGTFDTFKIETSVQLQSAKDPTSKAQIEQQMWYAPAIDHWVKRTFVVRSGGRVRTHDAIELIEYGRR